MQVTSTSLPTPFAGDASRSALLPDTSLTREQADFSRILSMSGAAEVGKADDSADAKNKTTEDRARATAERLVAVVLVQPILKQMRESNQAAEPFKPTRGEQQFQSMLDAKFAQEITQSARFPLVDRLARDMRQQMRTDAQPQFTATA